MDIEPDENYYPENRSTDSSDSGTSNKIKKNKNKRSNRKQKQEVHKKRKQANETIPSPVSKKIKLMS